MLCDYEVVNLKGTAAVWTRLVVQCIDCIIYEVAFAWQ